MSYVQWAEGWDVERFIDVLRERNGFTKCEGADGDCLYKDPSTGRTCAVGAFIPPEFYDRNWESGGSDWQSAYDLVRTYPQWFPITDGGMTGHALSQLQTTHDDCAGDWTEKDARAWAKEWVA